MMRFSFRGLLFSCMLLVPLSAACGGEEAEDAEVAPVVETEPATTAAGTVTEVPAEIAGPSRDYIASFDGEDPAAVGRFFTEDAVVTDADSTFTGRAQIQERWVAPNLPVVSDLRVSEQRFERTGEDIVESGRHNLMVTPPGQSAQTGGGSYTNTWTRAPDGTWKIRSATIQPDEAQATNQG